MNGNNFGNESMTNYSQILHWVSLEGQCRGYCFVKSLGSDLSLFFFLCWSTLPWSSLPLTFTEHLLISGSWFVPTIVYSSKGAPLSKLAITVYSLRVGLGVLQVPEELWNCLNLWAQLIVFWSVSATQTALLYFHAGIKEQGYGQQINYTVCNYRQWWGISLH